MTKRWETHPAGPYAITFTQYQTVRTGSGYRCRRMMSRYVRRRVIGIGCGVLWLMCGAADPPSTAGPFQVKVHRTP